MKNNNSYKSNANTHSLQRSSNKHVEEFLETWEEIIYYDDAKSFIVSHWTELVTEFGRQIPEEYIST